MGELFVLIALAVLVLPLILSIVALVRANLAREEVKALRYQLARMLAAREMPIPPPAPPQVSSAPAPPPVAAPVPAPEKMEPPVDALPLPPPPPPPVPRVFSKPATPAPPVLAEVTFGGKIASFAGIAMLLIGVAFLVGYAIKHAWLGPAARIVLGLCCGAALVVLGHVAEVRGKGRLMVLARALTGGGAAIFYFCVFAAYGIYGLIGPAAAGAGLVASAAAGLGLAVAYRSQAVAVIAVIGAFLMPPLIGRDTPNTLFLLTYIAVINVPVIALGVYRNWQALYNTAFGFTALYLFGQLADFNRDEGLLLLGFSLVYFLQFAGLGLVKLRAEREVSGRNADMARLLLNSLGLLGALYTILERMQWDAWTGAAFIAAAGLHIGLVRIGWKWRPAFAYDMLALLVGALTLASLALPIQLDGAWVSVGWSIEGAILCWFAVRARIPLLQWAAFLLGIIGLSKALVFDLRFYDAPPQLFLNARFISGALAAGLLGVQGWLHARKPVTDAEDANDLWTLIPVLTVVAGLLVCGADIFWTLGERHVWAWLLSSLILLLFALMSAVALRALPFMDGLARWLLLLIPAKVLLDVLVFAQWPGGMTGRLFFHVPFLVLAAICLFLLLAMPRMVSRSNPALLASYSSLALTLNLGALISGIILVTAELYRMTSDWNQPLVTIWWAGCAIALVVAGMSRHQRAHRYAGLWLFGITTGKVLLVDLSALSGLERIAAFMGVGVLLLALSFVYQRAAARLAEESAE